MLRTFSSFECNDSFFAMPFQFFKFIINHIIDGIRNYFHGKFKYILSNIVFAYQTTTWTKYMKNPIFL